MRFTPLQFERGFISPYFVTDTERMVAEYVNCKVLLVDMKIANAREIIKILENTIKGRYSAPSLGTVAAPQSCATLGGIACCSTGAELFCSTNMAMAHVSGAHVRL